MPKYFDEGGNEVTLDSLQVGAEISNMELDQYIKEFGFKTEGKITVPEETTPPTEPEKDGRWGFQFGRYFFGVIRG